MAGLFGDPWTPKRVVEPSLLRLPPTTPEELQQVWSGGTGASSDIHTLMISIVDLPSADPNEPLLRWRFERNIDLTGTGPGAADAGIAATSPSPLRLRKNGAANGTIDYTGTNGVINFISSNYAVGDLLELYPPTVIDATLDRLSITFETD